MNWFKYEIGDTVETPIGFAVVTTEPDEHGRCMAAMVFSDIQDGKVVPAGTLHEFTTFQFSKIISKKKENVNLKNTQEIIESNIKVLFQCNPKKLIDVLQLLTQEEWEYVVGDCCSEGFFIRKGIKL
jgi:glutamine amidotransferase-like uncharacterized protein